MNMLWINLIFFNLRKTSLCKLEKTKGITKRRNSGPVLWNIPPEFFDFFANKFLQKFTKRRNVHESPFKKKLFICFPCFLNIFCKYLPDQSQQKRQIT